MKVTINGKEYECKKVVMDNDNVEIILKDDKKKTGYERVDKNEKYCFSTIVGNVSDSTDQCDNIDNAMYDNANYYSSKEVTENNARADKLMRQLRRFSVENRENDIDWKNKNQRKFIIYYDYNGKELKIDNYFYLRMPNLVYFDSRELAMKVIEKFKDELIWYFTEYRDSL